MISSVTLDEGKGRESATYALINFANRIDAERVSRMKYLTFNLLQTLEGITNYVIERSSLQAKASDAIFNGKSLTLRWHKQSPSSANNEDNNPRRDSQTKHLYVEESNFDNNLYDDVDICDAEYERDDDEIAPPVDEEHMVDYDYEDEEHMVDYD